MHETVRAGISVLLLVTAACGGSAARAPVTPRSPIGESKKSAAPAPSPRDTAASAIWALPEGPRDAAQPAPAPTKKVTTALWSKASKVRGVAPAPASCAAFAKPGAAKTAEPDLGVVLLERDVAARDASLAALAKKSESGDTKKWAFVAIRAELAPTECADAIVDPVLGASSEALGASAQMALGLSLASKLSRTAANAPVMKDASDKAKVKRFIQGPLREWMVEQASAIDALSAPASELTGLARGVVAIEAGMADLRLVDRIRSAPTPSSWDKELKAVYEAELDQALEPRKTRGRDAALVGLADFAAAGIVQDARVDRGRVLLSKLYGGRRIDALDALLLPPRELAPTPIPQTLLVALDPAEREALHLPAAAPTKSARTRFEMGRKYWRRVDFVEAAHAAAKEDGSEPRLVLALSLALAKGPSQPKEMMAAASPAALGLTNTDALDALANDAAFAHAGLAAFDAAHLRSLSPPDGDHAGTYLADVGARFRRAAVLLEDPAQKKRAEERAADAEAAAAAAGAPPAKAAAVP